MQPTSRRLQQAAELASRGILSVSGTDAARFLQGLITSNIDRLSDDRTSLLYSALLNGPGRMLFDVFIDRRTTATGDSIYLIDHHVSSTADLLKHLRKFILRSKVRLEDVSSDYAVNAVWPPEASTSRVSGLRDDRTPGMGWRAIHLRDEQSNFKEVTDSSEAAFKLHRILQGVPEGPDDIVPGWTIPLEANFDYMGAVDFRKGCYVGQELTARTHHTGVTRKRFMPGRYYRADEPSPEALVPTSWRSPIISTQDVFKDRPLPHTELRPAGSALARPRPSGKIGSLIAATDSAGSDQTSPVLLGLALLRLEQCDAISETGGVFSTSDAAWRFRAFKPSWWDRAVVEGRGKTYQQA